MSRRNLDAPSHNFVLFSEGHESHTQLSKTNCVRALSSSSAQILAGTCNDLLGRPYVRFFLPDALKDIPAFLGFGFCGVLPVGVCALFRGADAMTRSVAHALTNGGGLKVKVHACFSFTYSSVPPGYNREFIVSS